MSLFGWAKSCWLNNEKKPSQKEWWRVLIILPTLLPRVFFLSRDGQISKHKCVYLQLKKMVSENGNFSSSSSSLSLSYRRVFNGQANDQNNLCPSSEHFLFVCLQQVQVTITLSPWVTQEYSCHPLFDGIMDFGRGEGMFSNDSPLLALRFQSISCQASLWRRN